MKRITSLAIALITAMTMQAQNVRWIHNNLRMLSQEQQAGTNKQGYIAPFTLTTNKFRSITIMPCDKDTLMGDDYAHLNIETHDGVLTQDVVYPRKNTIEVYGDEAFRLYITRDTVECTRPADMLATIKGATVFTSALLQQQTLMDTIFYRWLRSYDDMSSCEGFESLPPLSPYLEQYREGRYDLCPGSANNILLSNGHKNRVFAPETRRTGYTFFIVPDDVLAQKYGITTVEGLDAYARKVYGNNGEALSKLLAYHILDRALPYNKLTVRTSIDIARINPTEWYGTMLPHSTMKVENLTVANYADKDDKCGNGTSPSIYLNRSRQTVRVTPTDEEGKWTAQPADWHNRRGAWVSPDGIQTEWGYIYFADELVDYGTQSQAEVFDTRMRVELGTLFPELATNNILGNGDNTHGDEANIDGKYGKNYWFPKGYLDNQQQEGSGVFHYQFPHNCYWSYQGDEFNLKGDSYDVSVRLPSVPAGKYELRVGYCATATRGVAEVLLNNEPLATGTHYYIRSWREKEIVTDETTGRSKTVYVLHCDTLQTWPNTVDFSISITYTNSIDKATTNIYTGPSTTNRSNYLYGVWGTDSIGAKGNSRWAVLSEEVRHEERQMLRKHGYMHGPAGVYNIIGTGHKDDDGAEFSRFYDNIGTIRKILGTAAIAPNQDNWLRFRCVWAEGGSEFMLDYIELIPVSLCEDGKEDDL